MSGSSRIRASFCLCRVSMVVDWGLGSFVLWTLFLEEFSRVIYNPASNPSYAGCSASGLLVWAARGSGVFSWVLGYDERWDICLSGIPYEVTEAPS